mgnify:FL=1
MGKARAEAKGLSEGVRTDRLGFIIAAGVIAASALLGLFALPRISLSQGPKAKSPAAAFSLPVIHQGEPGSRIALEDLKGKAVILDFWATWCGPCAMQTPVLDRLQRRHQERGLAVVGINVEDDNPKAAAAYAQKQNLAYPIVLDETGLTQREYGVNRLPALFILDREGRVVHKTNGFVDEASLERLLRDVL